MRIFGSNKKQPAKETKAVEEDGPHKVDLMRSINTEGTDLSQPLVREEFRTVNGYIDFGVDNEFPQILNQLYISSPMHTSCVNFKTFALMGNGYEFEGYDKLNPKEKVEFKEFLAKNKFDESLNKIIKDKIKHGRSIAVLRKVRGEFVKFGIIDPANVRNDNPGLFGSPSKYFYSRDFSKGLVSKRTFSPYGVDNNDEHQVLELKNEVGGLRSYGLPDWVSSANWANVGADLGLLHKSALENGIQPSVIYKYPYIMDDEEERNWVKNTKDTSKGVKNYNRAIKVEANGTDNLPEITTLDTTENHQLFEQTSKEYKEEVCISHNINPSLMGVKVAGQLGQMQEIETSANIFMDIWRNPNATEVEKFVNSILDAFGFGRLKLKLNEVDILDEFHGKDTEGEEVSQDKEADARAELRGSVGGVQGIIQIQQSVSEGLTDRSSAAALLELIYGFEPDEAVRLLGRVKEGSGNNAVTDTELESDEDKPTVNDNLKGLTTSENADIYRIIRDHSRGKLNEAVAKFRLKGYGFNEEEINEILEIND